MKKKKNSRFLRIVRRDEWATLSMKYYAYWDSLTRKRCVTAQIFLNSQHN